MNDLSQTGTDNYGNTLDAATRAAAAWLIARQKPDGHWVGRAESNACMEAQWCLALWFLGLDDHPLRRRLAQSLLKSQRPDGSWQIYHNAPNGDINTTVGLRGSALDGPCERRARTRACARVD